jgi:hypothetical protein
MVCQLNATGTILGLSGGLLWTLKQTFGNHKMWGISWPAENLLVSERLCCLVLELQVKSGHDITAFVINILICQKFMIHFRNLYILNIKHKKWDFTSKRGISWKCCSATVTIASHQKLCFKSSRTRCIIRKKEVNITGLSAVMHQNHWRFTVFWGMRIVLYWRKNWSAGPGALMVQFLHPCNFQMIETYVSIYQSDF